MRFICHLGKFNKMHLKIEKEKKNRMRFDLKIYENNI